MLFLLFDNTLCIYLKLRIFVLNLYFLSHLTTNCVEQWHGSQTPNQTSGKENQPAGLAQAKPGKPSSPAENQKIFFSAFTSVQAWQVHKCSQNQKEILTNKEILTI